MGLAIGWFVAGDEETGNRVLNAAREALFYAGPTDVQPRTAVALAYAEALGFAPAGIALGRLEELFQRLDRVTVHSSSNCYFTLQPLRLIDTVVRAVVTDEFTLSGGVRAWLDGDEFLIRGRIHRRHGRTPASTNWSDVPNRGDWQACVACVWVACTGLTEAGATSCIARPH